MSDWQDVVLGELIYTNRKSIGREYKFSEILYLDTGSLTCNKITELQPYKLTDAPSRAKRLVESEDIIYSTVRPNQLHYGFIQNPKNNLVVSTGFVVITCDRERLLPKFLYYFLAQQSITEYLHSIAEASTSTYPSLKPSDIEALEIYLPSVTEQLSISSSLSCIDDKINLLHRQNATLEKLAETLFRQWFVVEANEDWEEGKLSDLITIKYGKDHKNLLDGNIPALGSGGIMRKVNKALYEFESVLIPRKGTLSNIMYIDEPFWTVDTMFFTIMKKPNLAKFIYHFLKRQDLESMNVGSAVPSLTTELLNNIILSIPRDSLLKQYEDTVSPLYTKLKVNNSQIRTLTKLRDTLLPKLMSGEITVEYND